LQGAGHISKTDADAKAKAAYDEYADQRRRLKEAEGARLTIESLAQHVTKDKK
jgi:hypothetical protein